MHSKTLETSLEKVSHILSHKYGVNVIFEGSSCKTDGNTIYLPSLPENVPDDLMGAVRGWCDHEVSHILYTQTELGPYFQKKHGRQAFGILNSLEDGRIERLLSEKYPGASINLKEALQFVAKKEHENASGRSPFNHFTAALYTRAAGRPDQDWVAPQGYMAADAFSEEIEAAARAETTEEVAESARRIWEQLGTDLKKEDAQEDDGAQGGDSSDSSEDQHQQEGDGEEETDDESPEEKPESAPGGPEQSEEQEEKEPQGKRGSGSSEGFSSEESPMDRLSSLISKEAEQSSTEGSDSYRVYTDRYDVVEVPEQADGYDYREELKSLESYASCMRRKLLQTLQGRQKVRWLRSRSRGKLDPRALHRLRTNASPKVFRQQRVRKGGDTACTLLLDVSASMRGPQIKLCRHLALVFAQTLSLLEFPTEIIAFSTADRDLRYEISQETGVSEQELARRYSRIIPLYHAVFKQFDEPWKKAARRLGQLRSQALTPLGESLLFAAGRLARREERRKVLMCLTDGEPVTGAWNEQVTFEHAREAVKRISHAGIEPVGIGIQAECVQDLFPRSAVIYVLEELTHTFLSELRKVLSQQ